jgi:hypothetical protein
MGGCHGPFNKKVGITNVNIVGFQEYRGNAVIDVSGEFSLFPVRNAYFHIFPLWFLRLGSNFGHAGQVVVPRGVACFYFGFSQWAVFKRKIQQKPQ